MTARADWRRRWWATIPAALVVAVLGIASGLAFAPQSDAEADADAEARPAPTATAAPAPTPRAERPSARQLTRQWDVIAHRGGTTAGPENTLPTFEHALGLGVNAVELDVRFTADGVPVVFHDALLDRTTDCAGRVGRVGSAALRGCDAGSWFHSRFAGARVPTLDVALTYLTERAPTVGVLLHVNSWTGTRPAVIVAALKEHGLLEGGGTILCHRPECLQALRAAGASRLAYLFFEPAGWHTRDAVLIPYGFPMTEFDVFAAQARGSRVLAVEGRPHSLAELRRLGLDGVLANDLEEAFQSQRMLWRSVDERLGSGVGIRRPSQLDR